MATILVGDIHGCYDQLQRLLVTASFNPEEDNLWLTGDLVARGSQSLAVLRFAKSLGTKLKLSLGNHDLHLLAIYAGISRCKKKDKFTQILEAPDCDELMTWLRKQPVLQFDDKLKLLMVHSGISPQWNLSVTLCCAEELTTALAGDNYAYFLAGIYGDKPDYWSPNLQGTNRLRYISNVFTRMRYCYSDARLNFDFKDRPDLAPATLKPWFMLPSQIPPEYSIVFGHWASLRGRGTPNRIYALDTACCWGGQLTALRFEDKRYFRQSCDSN